MTHIAGCKMERLDQGACKAWLDHVLSGRPAPEDIGENAWVLCHCDDGVTWGRYENGTWRLASNAFPDLAPVPSQASLQEMRVFSTKAEVLVWPAEDGPRGRVLRDTPVGDTEEALRPDDEDRLLLSGQVFEQRDGFTRVGDGSGAEDVLPLRVAEEEPSRPGALRVRNYFVRDEQTGCVRVAVTRLVEVI